MAGGKQNRSAASQGATKKELQERTNSFLRDGDLQAAEQTLLQLLMLDPEDPEVIFKCASAQAAQGRYDDAINTLQSIPEDHPEAGLAALGQAADWCMKAERFAEAERKYLAVLSLAPDTALVHRQLAYLLNRQGRRHEAAEHIMRLCQLGDVRADELQALMSLADAVYDAPGTAVDARSGGRGYWPISPVGEARKQFTDRKYIAAADLIREYATEPGTPPSVKAFFGRTLIEAQQEDEFVRWWASCDDATRTYSEYWAALGAYLVSHQRFEEAARALGEAVLRDPTDARTLKRMHQALKSLGRNEEAERWYDRFALMRSTTLACNRVSEDPAGNLDSYPELIGGLQELGRPLEAVLWELVEAFYSRRSDDVVKELNLRRKAIAESTDAFPAEHVRLCNLSLDAFKSPQLPQPTERDLEVSLPVQSTAKPRFIEVGDRVGLDHAYQVAAARVDAGFSIYQSFGGGVAVIDFDLDGNPDLYFAQGMGEPPDYIADESNILYRAVDGKLVDVSESSATQEYRYSLGVTVGDWNQDGFPDLVVANLGANTLFINNGDGTFSAAATDSSEDPSIQSTSILSTSIAMADMSGDALPDIIEIRYADDDSLPRKPIRNSKGEMSIVGPFDFQPCLDRVLVNDAMAGRVARMLDDAQGSGASTGLGVVISDLNGLGGNEIFIGNDMGADHLWVIQPDATWSDVAAVSGCAWNNEGARTATMGIAAADFDASGTLDLWLTNFENEPATLYLNQGTSFQDRAVQYRISEETDPVLSFGAQAIDFDNNGTADVVITNGHVENTGSPNRPFRQPMQLFANEGDRFRLVEVEDSSGYFAARHLGRALAKLDFNRDGKTDLVVTHIQDRSALLLNQTETDNHWLRVRLVGTDSERDAIGARVTVQYPESATRNSQITQWVTAGDGFLCRNEQVVTLGVGANAQPVTLLVDWPKGSTQRFEDVSVDQDLLIVEGDDEAFAYARLSPK